MTSTKTFATSVAVVGLGLAVAFSAFAFAPVAKAQTTAELQAQIQSLLATIAQLQAQMGSMGSGSTSGGASVTFTRDLTIGSSGSDVTTLQNWLIGQGHAIAAGATGYFGAQTQAALAAYQSANAISPASGYFGPITRAKVNASGGTSGGSTSGGSSGGLEGGEGELNSFDTLGDVEATVDEGEEDQKVLGVEFDAEDSDMSVERVDVEFDTHSGAGSSQLDHYVDSVSLWFNGEMIEEMDVDEGDEDDDVWTFRFSGLDLVTDEDDTSNIYVAVNVIEAMDSDDSGDTWDVEIPVNGIRAVDADGNSEQYDSSAYEETVTFETADGGDLDVTEASDSPEAAVVVVDEDADTNGVELMIIELEADNQDLTIEDIPVGLVASEDEGVDGAVKTVYLMDGDDTLDSKSVPTSAGLNYEVVFDDLSLELADGETMELSVVVDLNDADVTTFATGTTLYATTSGSDASWDVEDAMGDDVTPDGDITGETMTFQTEGIQVEFVSASATKTFTADDSGENDIGEFKIVFDVTALEDDIYLARDSASDPDRDGSDTAGDGALWATTSDSTTGTTTSGDVLTANVSDSDDTTDLFKIDEGETRRFTVTVTATAGVDGVTAIQLTGINWDTDSSDTTPDNFYNSDMDDFKTDVLSLLQI